MKSAGLALGRAFFYRIFIIYVLAYATAALARRESRIRMKPAVSSCQKFARQRLSQLRFKKFFPRNPAIARPILLRAIDFSSLLPDCDPSEPLIADTPNERRHPGELLASMMQSDFCWDQLSEVDPRNYDYDQLMLLIGSFARDEENYKLAGKLLEWIVSWYVSLPSSLYSQILTSHAEISGDCKHSWELLERLRTMAQESRMANSGFEWPIASAAYLAILRQSMAEMQYELMSMAWAAMAADGIRPSVHGYTIAMTGHTQAGNWTAAIDIFKDMKSSGVEPDPVAYAALMQALAKGQRWDAMDEVIRIMKFSGVKLHPRSNAILLESYIERKLWERASEYYRSIVSEEGQLALHPKSYIMLIRAFSRSDRIQDAEDVYLDAPSDHRIRTAMIQAYKAVGNATRAFEFLREMGDTRKPISTLDCNFVLSALSKASMKHDAWTLFDSMRASETHKYERSKSQPWVQSIDGLTEASNIFPTPDSVSYEIMMHMCSRQGDHIDVEKLHTAMRVRGMPQSSYSVSARMKTRADKEDWEGVIRLFVSAKSQGMGQSFSVHVYNIVLLALLRLGKFDRALMICNEMKSNKVRPTAHTRELLLMLSEAGTKEVSQRISGMQAVSAATAAAGLAILTGLL
mmetsp:Transcript_5989/g.8954  ORF Transcript_5989/g.8954 Transcript_5989/m.8954 type:complete len:632 (-) Transcript_5989:66-1961(-)